ncbi:toll/interleukin-1 receptor domain-containing protein [Sphingomonas xanthus]|uniref:toll/interleukin-1 receptor domain-containing protein n=1 Tax=Sphingomonas xanthus TaxID=2594473 RepID=UPI00164D1B9B|nr:toll/interleukin-1 receptor domain-containing protein [Sphingomonas xanthus]
MAAQVFLSLSYVDAEFVADVKKRLPFGLAHFYPESFENGEKIIHAMQKRVEASRLFVLFASPEGLTSAAVKYEMAEAEKKIAFDPAARLLIFPTAPEVTFKDLPKWMQDYWMGSAGYSSADIARYITTCLLAPNEGLATAATKVIGRGETLNRLESLSAELLHRKRVAPRVYILAGFSGIGRRTFASYFMRTSLAGEAALAFGPTIRLAAQADLIDLYRELRDAIDDNIAPEDLRNDQSAFGSLDLGAQVDEVARLLTHFSKLGQAVTFVSTSGFSEDSGEPKDWVRALIPRLPQDLTVFIVSNRQFPEEFIEELGIAVQMRVEELKDRDTKTLMIYTADRLRVEDLSVPDEMIKAIGGHPDVANAAVRLAKQKGMHALSNNPGYLYNVQRTILGEALEEEALSTTDRAILDTLCWVPALGGDIVQEIVCNVASISDDQFIDACQQLVMGCLVIAQGYSYSIASPIRQLYRRWYVTPPETLTVIATTLAAHWKEAEKSGKFREDLFEAFVYMHAFKGEKLPDELKGLLSPGTLEGVVSETYNRGKNEDDPELLERAVTWGSIAEDMEMSASVREEILGTVARAQIRLAQWDQAQHTLNRIKEANYQSYHFLQGHFYRRRGNFQKATDFLEVAAEGRKFKRSAVHELAITYSKRGRDDKLDALLHRHSHLIEDSAMFLDFSIGQKLKKDDLKEVFGMIRRLRAMGDDEGKADRREAQLLIREGRAREARVLLTKIIEESKTGHFHLRSLRSIAASKDKDFALAKRDIDFVRSLRGREHVAFRLEAEMHLEAGQPDKATASLKGVEPWYPEDWKLYARILEAKWEASSSLTDRSALKKEIDEIKARYGTSVSLDF